MTTLEQHYENVENLIAQNQIEAARDYCLSLDDPEAANWLSQIDDLFLFGSHNPLELPDGEVRAEVLARHKINAARISRIAPPAKEKSKNDDLPPLERVAFIDFFADLVISFLQKGGSSFR